MDLHNDYTVAKPVGVLLQMNFEHFIKQIGTCDEMNDALPEPEFHSESSLGHLTESSLFLIS